MTTERPTGPEFPAYDPFGDDEDWDDEFALVRRALALFKQGKTGVEWRAALIYWLRAAVLQVEGLEKESGTSSDTFDPSLGEVLISALEALNYGTVVPLLKPEAPKKRARGEIARAKARAVASVDVLVDFAGYSVEKAIKAVSSANGMGIDALRSLRSAVAAGKKYAEIRHHVDVVRNRWVETGQALERMGRPQQVRTHLVELRRDRVFFTRLVAERPRG